MQFLDYSRLPVMPDGSQADFLIGSTNGGLTIHCKIGMMDDVFGDSIQEAMNLAIDAFHENTDYVDDSIKDMQPKKQKTFEVTELSQKLRLKSLRAITQLFSELMEEYVQSGQTATEAASLVARDSAVTSWVLSKYEKEVKGEVADPHNFINMVLANIESVGDKLNE